MQRFRHFRNAVFGFVLGVVTLPIGAILWPFYCAAWLWCETDTDLADLIGDIDGGEDREKEETNEKR